MFKKKLNYLKTIVYIIKLYESYYYFIRKLCYLKILNLLLQKSTQINILTT